MSEWNPVNVELPDYDKTKGSLGVEVDVLGDDLQEEFAFYGVRHSEKPNFYLSGEIVKNVTHWKYRD